MLKLPLCPYCGARFLYPEVRKTINNRKGICPHCGGTFRIYGKANRAALYAVSLLMLIGMNLCLIKIPSMNLTVLLLATIIGVMVTRLLIPYTVRYGPL
ncbi:MAG: Znf/thioredoxin-put domain-containing protein [Oscillospiraceae bacterium]|jgi:CXXC-20-CXXC protein